MSIVVVFIACLRNAFDIDLNYTLTLGNDDLSVSQSRCHVCSKGQRFIFIKRKMSIQVYEGTTQRLCLRGCSSKREGYNRATNELHRDT